MEKTKGNSRFHLRMAGKGYETPFRLLVVTIASVFLAEVIVMFVLSVMPPLPMAIEALLDGLLLALLIFPLLYLFSFRPMVLHIAKRRQAEEDLQKANIALERQVENRTAMLRLTNEQLKTEVEDRKQAEEDLRKSQEFVVRAVESIPYLLFIFDVSTQGCTYVNGRITDMLGYKTNEIYLMGTNFLQKILIPEDLPSFIKLNDRFTMAKEGEIIRGEYRLRHARGKWQKFCLQMVVCARTAEGLPREILCTAMAS